MLLIAVPPAFDRLASNTSDVDLAIVYRSGGVISLYILAVLAGFALWLCIYSSLELVRKEFIERALNKSGSGQQRNAALIGYYLSLPIAFGGVLAFVGYLVGFNWTAALVAGGTIGVGVGFALQHVLANVFAGFSLALDTPFSKNDLIRVGSDNKLYEVIKRGIRITTVRDIETHEIVYLPNQSLITQPIVDVTRPTDDLRAVIKVSVQYGCDLRGVRKILLDIAHGHPHVVGPLTAKQDAIAKKVHKLYVRREFNDCKEHFIELARLKAENDLNEKVRDLRAHLENWAQFIDKHESGGFAENEKKWLVAIARELDGKIDDIRKSTTQWMILFRNCVAKGRAILFQTDAQKRVNAWKPNDVLIGKIAIQSLSENNSVVWASKHINPEIMSLRNDITKAVEVEGYRKAKADIAFDENYLNLGETYKNLEKLVEEERLEFERQGGKPLPLVKQILTRKNLKM